MLLKIIASLKTTLFPNSYYLTSSIISDKEKRRSTKKVSLQKKGKTLTPLPIIADKYKQAMFARRREREMRDDILLRKSIRGIGHRFKIFAAMINTKPSSRINFDRSLFNFMKEYGKTKRTFTLTSKERLWLFAQFNLYRKLALMKRFLGMPFATHFFLDCISRFYSGVTKVVRFTGRLFKVNQHRIEWFLANPLFKERKGPTEIGIYTSLEKTHPEIVNSAFESEIYISKGSIFEIPVKDQFSRKYEEPDFGVLDELLNDYEDEITAGRIYRTKMSIKRAFTQDRREYRRFKPWTIPWGYLSRNRVIARFMRFSFPKRLRKSLKKIPKYYWYKHEASFDYVVHGYVNLSFVNNIRHFFTHKIISKFTTVYPHIMHGDSSKAYYTFDRVKTYITYPLYPFMSLQKGFYRFYYTKIRRVFEDFYLSFNLFLKKYTSISYKLNPLLDKTIMREKFNKLRSLEREYFVYSLVSSFKLSLIQKLKVVIKFPLFQLVLYIAAFIKTLFGGK